MRIDVLVCKASGGAATEAKLIAARELGLPVIMVRRPPAEPGESVETVEAALDWLAGSIAAPRSKEGVMRARLTAILALAALAAAVGRLGGACADLNLFGGYWDNVARAARRERRQPGKAADRQRRQPEPDRRGARTGTALSPR